MNGDAASEEDAARGTGKDDRPTIFLDTEEALINDDLDGFSRLGRKLGRAAIRTVGDVVYAVLTGNPTMADGVALFHATHANLLTASAINTAGVDAMRTAMALQKDVGQTTGSLNLDLAFLLVPKALEGTELLAAVKDDYRRANGYLRWLDVGCGRGVLLAKFGDGAADVTPLFGLPKRRVRELGRHLGVPERLVEKVPTADLEDDKPLIPDEVALGVRYAVVDDYLEGADIGAEDEATILGWYRRTGHKRALPVTPAGWEATRPRTVGAPS